MRSRVRQSSEQRHDGHVVDLFPDERAHAHLERRTPADPDRETVTHMLGNVAAGRVTDDCCNAFLVLTG